ncbi:type IV secretory system conjugative DNA transfer family protein [Catenulispora sp. GP43]|uniref:type IV secretory system conjugative DNA transfer family protein n=1 Tax=Catenulispora sp. GP43 TaxID=3156263 RepID=UPI003511725C
MRFLIDPNAFVAHAWNGLVSLLTTWWPVTVPSLVAVSGLVSGTRLLQRARHRRLMADGARLVSVQLPPQVGTDGAAKFWSHLHAVLRPRWRRLLDGQPHLAFEYCFTEHGAEIGIWVPGVIAPGVVESAVESAWPGARTTVFNPATAPIPTSVNAATGGRLRLARCQVLPLNTKHDSDPLRALLGAGSALAPGEHAAVQILARPATGHSLRVMRRQINRMRARTAGIRRSSPRALAYATLDELTPGVAHVSVPFGTRLDPVAAAELRAAVAKSTGSLWECEIRYAAATTEATSPGQARRRTRGVAGALAATFGVYAERNWLARRRLHNPVTNMSRRHFDGGDLLNIAELAAVAHLPSDPFALGVTRAGARCLAPPPAVSSSSPALVLGDSDAGPDRPIGLNIADARRHTHVLGSTGSGKSTLMANMILDDVAARRGVVVIDPKGDLIADVLDRLPEQAGPRVVLIDPTGPHDGRRHPTLNILAPTGQGADAELLAENLVGIFRRTFAAHWGPRTDDVLRAAILTLQATADAQVLAKVKTPTLNDIPDLLTNPAVRRRILSQLPNTDSYKVLRGFWRGFDSLSEAGRTAAIAPLLNKLRAFLLRDFVQATIGEPASTIDLRQVLDGGILLVRLPKGVLGEETARLLGSFIVAATWHAASARAKTTEGARSDARLILDEAHNFLAMPIPMEDMLAEARAYRLALVLAHQNLAQMPPDLREGISANTRNKVFFACSPEDAKTLTTHVSPQLSEHDLAHLGGFQAAVRLSVDGVAVPAFTMRTRPLPPPFPGRSTRIRELAAATTAARHEQIEDTEHAGQTRRRSA